MNKRGGDVKCVLKGLIGGCLWEVTLSFWNDIEIIYEILAVAFHTLVKDWKQVIMQFSKIYQVFGLVAQLSGQLVNNFFENHWIYILSQHVKQEEVSHLSLPYDYVDALFLYQSKPNVE